MTIRKGLLFELAFNFFFPWLAYRLALPYWGELGALYASAVPPVVWSMVEFARHRRVDALSVLVLLGIVLSVGVMFLGGSPRLLLVRESLISGAIGAAFVVSLLWPRPLIYFLLRATVVRQTANEVPGGENGEARFERVWREQAGLRRAVRMMTLVWGVGLVIENLLRCWMAWHWSIDRYLLISPFVGYGIYGALVLWTLVYRKRLRPR